MNRLPLALAGVLALAGALLFGSPYAQAQNCSGQPAANTICAGPASGGNGLPGFRALVPADMAGAARVPLTGNQNYYVNGNSSSTAACGPAGVSTCSAGSDSNDCLTPATACLTLQHVADAVMGYRVDLAGHNVSIFLAHNTGTTNYDFFCGNFGPVIGLSVFNVIGDSASPAATVVQSPAGGFGLQVKDLCTVEYQYISFIDAGTNNAAGHIFVGANGNAGHLDMTNITLGSMTIGAMVTAGNLGSISAVGPTTITGGAPIALVAKTGGLIDFAAQTVTVSGTPAFSTAFAYMPDGGIIGATNTTFSGSATGPRCIIPNSSILIGGFNPNAVFPGNANCVANVLTGAVGLQSGTSFSYGSSGQCLTSGGSSSVLNAWSNCSGSGVPQNVLNTQTANYTVLTSDCGKTIQAGTGSTGLFTVTLPAVGGFASNCVLSVLNGDSGRGKILSGFPTAVAASPANILWPGDTITVEIVNGAWSIQSYVGRHRITASTTLFVDNTNGADTNDCLAATTNACKTIQKAIDYINTWDGNAQAITVSVATGTYTNAVSVTGPFHGSPTVTLQGDLATPSNVVLSTTSATALTITNGATLTVGGFKITTATSGNSVAVANASFMTISGLMEYGASAGFHFQISASSSVTVSANYTISGNATRHWNVTGGSVLTVNASVTVTLTGTPAFTTFAQVATGASINVNSVTFSGSATGAQYVAALEGIINNSGTLPGSTAGSVTTRGFVGTPGTPGVSSCGGGSPAVTAGSTDFSGSLTEGTTATACTITFTTATTFKSCSVSLSTGNAVGITTLSTTLVVAHASLSSNVLYWTCSN